MPRYAKRYTSENFVEDKRKENKNSANIYTSTIKTKRKTKRKDKGHPEGDLEIEKRPPSSPRGGSQNIASPHSLEFSEGGTVSQELAAQCIPSELRPYFRPIYDIDPELRPQNYKVIQDVFSKCRLCTMEEGKFVPLDWTSKAVSKEKGDDSSEPQEHVCMAWVKKNSPSSLNSNMYFCFHGKNILIRRILFEWFVGPTQLTEKEKEAFQKKRCRNRKKPRRIHTSCSFSDCILPEHMKATPPLPEYIRDRMDLHSAEMYKEEEEEEGDESEGLLDSLQKESPSPHKEKEQEESVVNGVQGLARDGLLGASRRSISILERMEARKSFQSNKRKRVMDDLIECRGKRFTKMSKYVDDDDKSIVPLSYQRECYLYSASLIS